MIIYGNYYKLNSGGRIKKLYFLKFYLKYIKNLEKEIKDWNLFIILKNKFYNILII